MPSEFETEIAANLHEQYGNRFKLLSGDGVGEAVAIFRQATLENLGDFWEATQYLGRLTMIEAIREANKNHNGDDDLGLVLVGIPRGGYPMLAGAMEVDNRQAMIVTNDGGWKNPKLPLVPEEVQPMRVGKLLVIDPVLDTGQTVRRTLQALAERGVVMASVVTLTIISHPPTVGALLNEYPALRIVTADTESGIIPQPDGSRWLAGFGDAGGQVEASFNQRPDLGVHLLQPGFYLLDKQAK